MIFYLGTHKVTWLRELTVPLFISHTRLKRRKSFPRARCLWSLDSGAFSELSKHGRWVTEEVEYVEAVHRYADQIGGMHWAAPMDWMCEPHMLALTGKSVREHQELTLANYCSLIEQGPFFIPVLQGWTVDDYLDHLDMYLSAGLDPAGSVAVGIGSVCRRQGTQDIEDVFRELWNAGLHNMHGFGVKTSGLARYGQYLRSSDSMAWSSAARRKAALPECTHTNCANCVRYALKWRRRVLQVTP